MPRTGQPTSLDAAPWRSLAGFAAALVVGLLVAILTTRDQVEVPPQPLFVGGAAAITWAVCLLQWHGGRRRTVAGLVAFLAAGLSGIAAGHVLFAPGAPRVHDLIHLWGVWAYGRAVGEGSIWPLWLPWLGAGTPLLQFYGPVGFLLALPGVLWGLSPVGAWKLDLLTGHVLSSVAMLLGARLAGLGWRGATLSAFALAFAPWRLTVAHYRGALGEAQAFVAMPLVAGAALGLVRRGGRRAATALVSGLTLLVLTHLLTLVTLVVTLLPALGLATRDAPRGRRRRHWVLLGIAAALALGLTAAWWLPATVEARHTNVATIARDNLSYHFDEQGVALTELFRRRQWDRLRFALADSIVERGGFADEEMPFYTGAVLLVLGLTAPLWSRSRAARAAAAGALLGLLLSTTWAARFADVFPINVARFPWRFLSPASVLAALALGAGVDAVLRRHRDGPAPSSHAALAMRPVVALLLPATLVAALAWDALPYTGAADRIPPYEGTVHWVTSDPNWVHWHRSMHPVVVEVAPHQGVARVRNLELPPSRYETPVDAFYPGYYDWLTPTVYERYWRPDDPSRAAAAGVRYAYSNTHGAPQLLQARPYATLERSGQPFGLPREVRRAPGHIRVEVDVPEDGARLIVLEQSFPGWRARVDGGPATAPLDEDGFMAVDLSAGSRVVVLRYGWGTAARRAGLAVTLACGSGFVILWMLRRRIPWITR